MNPIRFLVIFFNFIFLILGIILIGIGVWGEVSLENYFKLSVLDGFVIDSAPRILIAVGVIIALVTLFGFLGAWKENKILLIIFFVLLLILLALEIAAAVLAFKKKDELQKRLEDEVKSKMKSYSKDNKIKGIDDIQQKLKCCGYDSYKDWGTINPDLKGVPSSCCRIEKENCGHLIFNVTSLDHKRIIYTRGCYKQASSDVKTIMVPIGAVTIFLIIVQVLGMIFALVLIRRIGKQQ